LGRLYTGLATALLYKPQHHIALICVVWRTLQKNIPVLYAEKPKYYNTAGFNSIGFYEGILFYMQGTNNYHRRVTAAVAGGGGG
jgi:hypothetical protein